MDIMHKMQMAIRRRFLETVFRGVTRVELWVRRITGAVFIVAGTYYAAVYIFEAL